MKQYLISSGLACANFVQRHPKRITAVVAATLLSGAGGALAVAKLMPPPQPPRLVSEPVEPLGLAGLLDQTGSLDAPGLILYRNEQTHAADTPEALLKRRGIADPAAAAFLRRDAVARQALFNRPGRNVTAQANVQQELLSLRAHWIEGEGDNHFKRLVVERAGAGFTARIETAALAASQRLAGGVIRNSLHAATDAARVPDSVTRQLTEIFDSSIDFHRGLYKGDRFSIVYETLEADGQPLRAGRVLSAEMVNHGKTYQALWFKQAGAPAGAYYTLDGHGLRHVYLMSPVAALRITSGFGMREHPVFGFSRQHTGVDYAAPIGTPVRAIGDGTVTFAGQQHGYGNVIQIKHRNGRDSTLYAHLSRIDVKLGASVGQGQTIGAVGVTGVTTGPHLHFEFRINNVPTNPSVALANQRENAPIAPSDKAVFAHLAGDMKLELAAASNIALGAGE
jgi:murein DD-endopeptidase MepM/ murein hydrolase activator NlpD